MYFCAVLSMKCSSMQCVYDNGCTWAMVADQYSNRALGITTLGYIERC